MIGASLITFMPDWNRIDPLLTFIFSIIVIFTTVPITKDCVLILMESTPREFNPDNLKKKIMSINGVLEVFDLKVWSLS